MITYSIDYVTTFFDYVRISGWAFSADNRLSALNLTYPEPQTASTKIGLPSPDVQLGDRLRFTVSALIPDFDRSKAALILHFEDGTAHSVALDVPADPHQEGSLQQLIETLPGFDLFLSQLSAIDAAKILEIGARDRTGTILKSHFAHLSYVGLDIAEGRDVDLVGDAHEASRLAGIQAFDAVVSVNTFEHLAMPWKVGLEINRLLRKGGIGYISSHQSLGMHELPTDFWRFGDVAWHSIFNAQTGFEVLSTYLAAPNFIIPFERLHDTTNYEGTAGFAASSVVFRKISETKLRWDVSLSDLPIGIYATADRPSSVVDLRARVKRTANQGLHWLDAAADSVEIPCPACADRGAHARVLRAENPDRGPAYLSLLRCLNCQTCFWQDFVERDQGPDLTITPSADFYITQSAGLGAMIRPLVPLSHRRDIKFLEIGCGFGFAMDMCRRLFGWQVHGIDPSPLAKNGAATLGLDIARDFLSDQRLLNDDVDVIFGSEVIEHLAEPNSFLQQCAANLYPNGILVLRTPAAEAVQPDVRESSLRALLSPGDHHVIFSRAGLETALYRNGFAEVVVLQEGDGLIAYASNKPLPTIAVGASESALLLTYLKASIEDGLRDDRILLGYKSRYFKELVHRGNYEKALKAYETFKLDFERLFHGKLELPLPDNIRHATSAKAIARISNVPWYLPTVLYARAMIALNQEGDYQFAQAAFAETVGLAANFRVAHPETGCWDGETEAVEALADYHALLAMCHFKPAEAAAALATRYNEGAFRLDQLKPAFQRLVDLGHIKAARSLRSTCGGLASVVLSDLDEAPERPIGDMTCPDSGPQKLYGRRKFFRLRNNHSSLR